MDEVNFSALGYDFFYLIYTRSCLNQNYVKLL